MAKQAEDTKTIDMIPQPTKRGRPATGGKSAAQRKREQRERDRTAAAEGEDISTMTTTGILERLGYYVKQGHDALAREAAHELVRRSRANKLTKEQNS